MMINIFNGFKYLSTQILLNTTLLKNRMPRTFNTYDDSLFYKIVGFVYQLDEIWKEIEMENEMKN